VSKLAIALASLVVTVAAIEIGLRVLGLPVEPFRFDEIVPWNTGRYTNFTPRLNSDGFREEPDFPTDKPRILMLGDSYTAGFGVVDGSRRFSDLVERDLGAHVYNAGVPGTAPHDWGRYLDLLLPTYMPNCVVVVLALRDATDLCTSLRCWQKEISALRARYHGDHYGRFAVWRLVANALMIAELERQYVGRVVAAYTTNTDRWRYEQGALVKLRDTAVGHGVPFGLVVFPLLHRLDGYRFGMVDNEIDRFAKQAGIPTLFLTRAFSTIDESDLWVSRDDQHPNEAAHAVAATAMAGWIRQTCRHKGR